MELLPTIVVDPTLLNSDLSTPRGGFYTKDFTHP